MRLRTRLLIFVTLAVVVTAVAATWVASALAERTFEALDDQRTQALVAQFRREFERRGREVLQQVEGIAGAESTERVAIDLGRAVPDYSAHVREAGVLAKTHGLEFLELIAGDGTLISSAQYPARFGFKAEWVTNPVDWNRQPAFLKREELPDGPALALVAVREVKAGDGRVYVVAGRRLDREFLATLILPAGMRVLLYRNFEPGFSLQALTDAAGPVAEADRLAPIIEQARAYGKEFSETVPLLSGPETFQVFPLEGRENELLGVLLVGRSRRELASLVNRIRTTGALSGGAGVLLGVLLSFWVSARITRPVEMLAKGAREVARGNWDTHVAVASRGEIGELAEAFNRMTQQLIWQRDRLVQTERVAAWRELARRLAHEMKNPLFPLQITIENLQRAKERAPEQFDEILRESTQTMLAELENMKGIVGRFSDFARMPAPQPEPLHVNALVRNVVKLFEAQFHSEGGPAIAAELDLDEEVGTAPADPQLLGRALQNLMLNAIDAMPQGGTLAVRTRRLDGGVQIEVSDTGHGLTKEECERLFTPYYTTKRHGTGLGLAIVQSVVSDHKGRITVESEPDKGTCFRIVLPAAGGGVA